MEIKIISLDAMNTLIRQIEHTEVIYARFAEKLGVLPRMSTPEMQDCGTIYYKVLEQCYNNAFCSMERRFPCYGGRMQNGHNEDAQNNAFFWWKEVIEETFEGLKKDDNVAEVYNPPESFEKLAHEIYDYFSSGNAWDLVEPKFAKIVDRVRKRNSEVKFVVTSNFDVRLHKILADLHLCTFDAIFISEEMGVQKPQLDVFERIMHKYCLSTPKEILHIGDSIDYDYKPAKKFGANALLFVGNKATSVHKEIPPEDIIFSLTKIESLFANTQNNSHKRLQTKEKLFSVSAA